MKNLFFLSTPVRTYLAFFFVLIAFQIPIWSQDPGVESIQLPPPQIFAHQATPVEITVNNTSGIPAEAVQVEITVLDLSSSPVFNWIAILPLVPPMSSVVVNTLPNTWYPDPPGNYLVQAQVMSADDTDPTNNILEQDVIAVAQPPVTFEQVDMVRPFDIPNSTYGVFCVEYPTLTDHLFLNVMAADPDGTGQDWIVRNMPLLPFPETQNLCYWFDLRQLGFEEGDDVPALDFSMRLDPHTFPGPFPVPNWRNQPVLPLVYNGSDGNDELILPDPPSVFTSPTFGNIQQLTWNYRGCTVPNIELDDTQHPATSDYAGDTNACGPAAAANSMQWLEDTHPNIPSNGTTHRQKMEKLSGHMGRANNAGVTTQQLVQGKLGYIDEYKLPIHVKYQSWFDTSASIPSPNPNYGHSAENKGSTSGRKPPTWDFLKSEMEKGEDVEILFGWYDNAGNRHGGHWVTVTGVSENTNFKGIYVKDDWDQDSATGTRQKYLNWHTDGDWSRLVGYDGPNNNCWVESVVSESYDPTVTFLVFNFNLDLLDWVEPVVPDPDPLKTHFTFSYPPSTDTSYMNIIANLPDSTGFWIARNVLLPPVDTISTTTLWWDLADLGLLPGQPVDTVEIRIGVDDTVWVESFFDVYYELDLDVDTVQYEVGNGAMTDIPVTIPFITLPPVTFDSLLSTTFVARGCEVPNIDLDSTANNPVTMPGYAGDKNACGPAAAANSLQWLENEDPNVPSSGTTHRDKLKELSEMMDRANNSGVFRKDFIEAKLEFIDKYKLPIHVKFQGFYFNTDSIPSPDTLYNHFAENENDSAFAKPQWDWLVQEMQNGEDVELEFGYYDENGVRRGGHWITVTGVAEVGGVKNLYFKDDTRQLVKGGMRHECTRWVTHAPTGFSYLDDISGDKYLCVVETVVSESYDPNITFCPDDLTINLDPIPSGTYSASETIYLSGHIPGGNHVILSAPNIIVENFSIDVGGTLATDTAGCQ